MTHQNIKNVKKTPPFISPTGEKIWQLVGPEQGLTKFSIAYVEISPGKTSPAHFHREFEESYKITSGQGRFVMTDGETVFEKPLRRGDAFAIPRDHAHQIFNDSKTQILKFDVVCAPAWQPKDMHMPDNDFFKDFPQFKPT